MFAKLSTLVALVLPLVSALTINAPTNPTSQGSVTITWTATTTDPAYFSIELVNTAFHNTYAIANNVQTALGSMTLTLPEVPAGDGYSIEAIAIDNINTVYSQTGQFPIAAATTSSTTQASTSSGSTLSFPSTTGTSSTPLATLSTPVSSVVAPSSSGTSSASASPSTFASSSGAGSLKVAGIVPAAALVLSAVAGAAMVF